MSRASQRRRRPLTHGVVCGACSISNRTCVSARAVAKPDLRAVMAILIGVAATLRRHHHFGSRAESDDRYERHHHVERGAYEYHPHHPIRAVYGWAHVLHHLVDSISPHDFKEWEHGCALMAKLEEEARVVDDAFFCASVPGGAIRQHQSCGKLSPSFAHGRSTSANPRHPRRTISCTHG